ncbi:MAG: NAD(P)-dependent alcohol dehydrogenase [Vulcanimicrobiota bacterium]
MSSLWRIGEWGLSNLEEVQHDCPAPGPGEVQIGLQAATLNYRDLLVVEGKYNPKFPRPLVPCSDGFGSVVAVGSGVNEGLLKRKVITNFCPDWVSGEPREELLRRTLGGPLPGVLQQRRNFRPSELLFLEEPTALTPFEWASLPCAGVTAWNCLQGLKPGQTVLLLGTGGVSLFGLQIAKMHGARVLLLSSSTEKRQWAREMGADAVGDYTTAEWGRWALEQTEGRGVDLILETGGAGTLAQSLKAVKVGGKITLVGVLSGHQEPLNILPLVMKSVHVQGAVVGNHQHARELVHAYMQSMQRPVVERIFSWEEVPEAFQALASGRQFGKIAIEFPE